MPIEIRELLIKVKVEENPGNKDKDEDLQQLRKSILNDCRKEIARQLSNMKER